MTMSWLYAFDAYLVALSWSGSAIAVLWLGGLLYAVYRLRRHHPRWQRVHWLAFVVLLLATPLLTAVVVGGYGHELPLPVAAAKTHLMFLPFAAIGWMLAAGLLGAPAAFVIALLTGALIGFWSTHLPTEALSEATLALVFAWALWQPYRTRFYRFLRQPLGAAVAVALLYSVIGTMNVLLVSGNTFAEQVDIALTAAPWLMLYKVAPLLVGGLVAQAVALWLPLPWGYSGELSPSPLERSLLRQFSFVMTSVMIGLALSILVGNWVLARRSARTLILKRLESTTSIAAQSMPFFTENGDLIIRKLASDPALASLAPAEIPAYLSNAKANSFFFDAILLSDAQGNVLASYPEGEQLLDNELSSVEFLVNTDAPVYHDTAFSPSRQETVVCFVAPVSAPGLTTRHLYLVGRTTLASNPYSEPIVQGLRALKNVESAAVIVDARGRIVYATRDDLDWVKDDLPPSPAPLPAEIADPSGEHYLVEVSQATGTTWRIIAISPVSRLQSIALRTALPLTLMVLVLALMGILVSRSLLVMVTASLRKLSVAAEHIARGQLNQPLEIDSVDEVGQLGQTFEYMRRRLRARMDELSRLLHTSQRVAATLKVDEAADAVLNAVLVSGATTVRIALSSEALPDDRANDYPIRFGRGVAAEAYGPLDAQLLKLVQRQSLVRISKPGRSYGLEFPPEAPVPQAVLAVALHYEQRFLGVLYALYNTPHTFTDEETRYISALGLQMAMAAYTARLYYMAEVRHQRLLAVLNASPDPILVTDKQGRLILANLAARTQLPIAPTMNRLLEETTTHAPLIALLRRQKTPPFSEEITIGNRVYFATVASVQTEEREVGRVCILRDITHFKELDALKSEFVSTVSHDLRAPLTLMNGYITMLGMVGELNERQSSYVARIQKSIQAMTEMVNNLLDLGRIESGVGLQLQLVSPLDIIDEIIKRWEAHARQKGITLRTEIHPDTPPLVEADPLLLGRVLNNLVDNAIKYTPTGGTVTVLARPSGDDKVLLGVRDTGVGISPLDQPRLFEKFFRIVRRGGPKEKGSGLGLAIVKSIVERHRGRVWVESQLGEGSTFFVELPLRQPHNK
ncbi:MAG TPA: HAMP domain-containing protein [Chloroflexi bacterium]|nr:HAMP domain-containing protein [Chloroflexota bacterium]